jgi:hypothetical protein
LREVKFGGDRKLVGYINASVELERGHFVRAAEASENVDGGLLGGDGADKSEED